MITTVDIIKFAANALFSSMFFVLTSAMDNWATNESQRVLVGAFTTIVMIVAFLLQEEMRKARPIRDELTSAASLEAINSIAQTPEGILTDMVIENGPDFLGISLEGKRQILLDLHEACAMEPPEDWDGPTPDQMMVQLASAWEINVQQLIK
ncbi:hypothetical protein J5N97_004741 [Dioscorea zingiberensis]|uniref:TORTIFOLIA1/TORL1-2 C-terminal domain-containing protein n=1 Tax=Dioscorea zingiberensis TaxID=325984 RepID=A0A9D5HR94_9LILI|nr:hypothetical protein J5N97_004741 [Dioscorea zingiberensis]